MANWQDLTARATQTADRVFGEPVRLSFFKNGEADPDRPVADIRAQLHLPGESDAVPGRSGASFTTQLVGGTGLLVIQKLVFNGDLRQGDKVRADDRDGQPWFEILSVDKAGASQIVAQISLSKKRGAA